MLCLRLTLISVAGGDREAGAPTALGRPIGAINQARRSASGCEQRVWGTRERRSLARSFPTLLASKLCWREGRLLRSRPHAFNYTPTALH